MLTLELKGLPAEHLEELALSALVLIVLIVFNVLNVLNVLSWLNVALVAQGALLAQAIVAEVLIKPSAQQGSNWAKDEADAD